MLPSRPRYTTRLMSPSVAEGFRAVAGPFAPSSRSPSRKSGSTPDRAPLLTLLAIADRPAEGATGSGDYTAVPLQAPRVPAKSLLVAKGPGTPAAAVRRACSPPSPASANVGECVTWSGKSSISRQFW